MNLRLRRYFMGAADWSAAAMHTIFNILYFACMVVYATWKLCRYEMKKFLRQTVVKVHLLICRLTDKHIHSPYWNYCMQDLCELESSKNALIAQLLQSIGAKKSKIIADGVRKIFRSKFVMCIIFFSRFSAEALL